jgi:uncharacterized protein (DUF1501 family)
MASAIRDKALVVIQLSAGNDCLDTVVPYTNGLYDDFRPTVTIAAENVLSIDDAFGFNPSMGPIKRLWDEGKIAIVNGIGYPRPDRSHFRSMDIWHTAEPEKIGKEGWLGRAIRILDPKGNNVLTGINFGRGLPRALGCRGVPVASVGNLETCGLYPDLQRCMWPTGATTASRNSPPMGSSWPGLASQGRARASSIGRRASR